MHAYWGDVNASCGQCHVHHSVSLLSAPLSTCVQDVARRNECGEPCFPQRIAKQFPCHRMRPLNERGQCLWAWRETGSMSVVCDGTTPAPVNWKQHIIRARGARFASGKTILITNVALSSLRVGAATAAAAVRGRAIAIGRNCSSMAVSAEIHGRSNAQAAAQRRSSAAVRRLAAACRWRLPNRRPVRRQLGATGWRLPGSQDAVWARLV